MASTNSTSHYGLSQYIASDKPTYLSDYNTDMNNIDTGMYNAQTKADSAYALAGTADGKADNATLTANSALTNAGTANTNIGSMANLTTTEKSNLVGAINEVNSSVNKFNIDNFINHGSSDVSSSQIDFISYANINTALNSDGSIGKIYGWVDYNVSDGVNKDVIITIDTPEITVTSSFNIVCGAIAQESSKTIIPAIITVNTNHTLTVQYYSSSNGSAKLILSPCLYFFKDFGD